MEDAMVGYDMVLSISQNEVNSQFERLVRAGYIVPEVKSNGIVEGGLFGGNTPKLTTYLRGWVSPPQVAFGKRNNAQEVEFQFAFAARDWAPGMLASLTELQAAFDPAKGATATDALLVQQEDVQCTDPKTGKPSVLAKQTIHYWIRRRTIAVGTTESVRYSVVPALQFVSVAAAQRVLVALDGLELRFAVQLNKIPATAQDFEDGVARRKVPPEVLRAITEHRFNEEVFSIEQLFLDFDTVDFTQWDLRDPAKGLGTTVSIVALQEDGAYTVRTGIPLSSVTQQDPQFAIELSTNLQQVFGLQDKNPAGRTPYILGVSVARPKATGPEASLTPVWIGYSTNPNPDHEGWSAINYEVLGGKDSNFERRIPRNPDKSIRHVATPFVSSNDFSGVLLFARSVFFDALIFDPVKAALDTGAPWTQSGTTLGSKFLDQKRLDHERHVVEIGPVKTGYEANVTQQDDHTYTVQIQGNRVLIDIELHRHVELKATLYLAVDKLDFEWSRDFKGSTKAVLEAYVDQDQQIRFKVTPPPDIQIKMKEHKNSLAGASDDIMGALEKIANKNFNPAQDTLNDLAMAAVSNFRKHGDALKQLIVHSSRTCFISPTGQVFLLNDPRYDDELHLRMDVTYSV
ncbi:hypothetical protein LVJ94_23525 [Pendulispora rubella]|uniref:MACPF domain-containing protein n=1 Tax=Pendulispora rubella TaxID=2741070 RepID=A0ABZ2LM01_9BACT